MNRFGIVCILVFLGLFSTLAHSATPVDTGDGIMYQLAVTQDVLLERGNRNYNYLQYLIVAQHPQYPLKRSLVQFEDLPSSCSPEDIRFAKMYLHYAYAHKASWHTVEMTPNIARPLHVNQVLEPWLDTQATSTWRMNGEAWSQPYLGLDNSDAEATPQAPPTYYYPGRPSGYMEFDVTRAVKNWAVGEPNYGLLVWATNEHELGRDIRFFSQSYADAKMHPVLRVLCEYPD
jgi:hypothetical protein